MIVVSILPTNTYKSLHLHSARLLLNFTASQFPLKKKPFLSCKTHCLATVLLHHGYAHLFTMAQKSQKYSQRLFTIKSK